jgi:hypothetical protein
VLEVLSVGLEADQLLPPSAKVKNECSYIFACLFLHGKDMGNYTFTFFFPFGNLCKEDFSKILCPFTAQIVSM